MAAVLTTIQQKLNGDFTPELDLFPYAAIMRKALALKLTRTFKRETYDLQQGRLSVPAFTE